MQRVVVEGEPLVGRDDEGTGAGQAVVDEHLGAASVREPPAHEVTDVCIVAADQEV